MSASNNTHVLPLSPNSTNTRKKRLACDNCHLSKVRCTGEINGCQRCQRGNKFCQYSESNMGRTLNGVQRRRKSAPKFSVSNQSHGDLEEFDWILSGSTSTNTTPTNQFSNVMPTPELDSLTDRSIHAREEYRSLPQRDSDFSVHHRQPSRSAHSLLMADLDDMDPQGIHGFLIDGDSPVAMEYPQIAHSTSSRSDPQQQQQRQARASIDTRPSTPSCVGLTTSKHADETNSMLDVHSWTRLLGELSRSGHRTPLALDELLYHSSTIVPRAIQALQSGLCDLSSMTPLLMILLCVTQTIALFEQCILSVIHGAASSAPKDIALRLGTYKVDREAQQALQRHLVTKELARIHHVAKLAKQVLQQPELTRVSKRIHCLLLDDLQAQANSLAYLVEDKWGAVSPLVF